MKKTQKSVRLSKFVCPTKYKITLKPNFETFTFSGEEIITLQLLTPTNKITLHSVDLKIESATISSKIHKNLLAKIKYNKKEETVDFVFKNRIDVGEALLSISFNGILGDNMMGFYRSKYELEGKTEYIATSQLESTHARRVFPSFDEPAQKAVFEVSLHVPTDMTAISNTIETEVKQEGKGYKTVTFAPTPIMSTYLLAFIVGKFEHIQAKTKEGTLIRVFVTPGKKKQAEFALDVAVKTLSFFHNYFGIAYPLPVLDLIAIPDFAAGAMENWGAVTYRETALLVDPLNSSTANKQWVALVIAHELAHQWFGNLVTMEWWTHLWLNEGFASYIEYLAVDHIFPEWHMWTQFVLLDHSQALQLDSLKNTHPIEVAVNHPDEINEIFDAVSYSKGASIIRMLAEYLGEKDFRNGLRQYLKSYSYSNASTADLWRSLEKASGKPVEKIIKNWTQKPGYPVVGFTANNKFLTLSQERFFLSPRAKKDTVDNTLWSIPIALQTDFLKKPVNQLMTGKTLKISLPEKTGWVNINPGEVSLIRGAYPKEYLIALQKPIVDKTLSVEDRFGVVRDAFTLAQAGEISTVDALELATAYSREDEYIVWVELAAQFGKLANLLATESSFTEFNRYAQDVFAPIAKKVGWEKAKGESHFQTLLRSIVLFSAGTYGDSQTIQKARELFGQLMKGKATLDADVRSVVYTLVAQNGGEKEYTELMNLYDKATLQEEKDRILRALCFFKQRNLLQKTISLAFSEKVRAQDAFRAVHFIWANPKGRYLAWETIQNKWSLITQKYSGGHLMPRFIQPAVNFTTAKDAQALKQFFAKHKAPGAERTIAQVLEEIYINADWLKRDGKKIKAYLSRKR